MENTQNYNLKKPAPEDFYDVADQNSNMDAVDAALKAHDDALAKKAGLDETGKVPAEQLPAFSTLELGETETTAYRGDRGRLAYEHSMDGTKHITAAEREKLAGLENYDPTSVDAHMADTVRHVAQSERNVWGGMTADILALQNGKADKTAMESGLSEKADLVSGKVPVKQLPLLTKRRFVVGTSTAGWTVNDCDYLCDGVDDQAEINEAIQALPAINGEIYILNGTYNISGTITLNKMGTVLRGSGYATVLKRSDAACTLLAKMTTDRCEVSYIRLDGRQSDFLGSVASGLSIRNYSIISHVAVERFGLVGIIVDGPNAIIEDSRFASNRVDIDVSQPCSIINNEFISATAQSINTGGSLATKYSIIGNRFLYANTAILCVYGKKIVIADNVFEDCSDTAIHFSASNSLVSNNICLKGAGTEADYTDTQYGIRVGGSGNLVANNLIPGKNYVNDGTGNTFINNKYN